MKQPTAATLSAHLIQEADKFLYYPERVRRTRRNLEIQRRTGNAMRKIAEWRATFAPNSQATEVIEYLTYGDSLDEWYCRDLLRAVPGMVERTVKLSHLTLSGISRSELVYLRQTANCYIFGLPQAAVALARAALEDCVRKKLAKFSGKKAVAEQDLKDLIDDLGRTKSLSREGRARADKVRIAGNEILHDQAARSPDALPVIEDARAVIMELSRR